MKRLRFVLLTVLVVGLLFLATSGSFLVVNNLRSSDVIVVLAGETDRRPARALELLSQHYAPKLLLNVPAEAKIYTRTVLQLANEYVDQQPQREVITICPITGLSTKAEAHDAEKCLAKMNVHTILLVSSDFHTRRALSTFEHELPGYSFSIAGASDPQQFGTAWWRHRQWAKQNIGEWLRLVWWECVDRWR